MRKILIRGGISPFERPDYQDIICRDTFGTNTGNMLYAFSVFRTLMTDDTLIEIDHYDGERNNWTEKDIDRINETYDAYVIPLADAFRADFANKLNNYANLFRKLKIPCYVIGVGLRAPYEPNLSQGFVFNSAVKNFVSAALEKSAMIGLRGEITGEYLKQLGFKPEKDFTVIGCPSMYTFGGELTQRPLNLSSESRISVNYSQTAPETVMKWLLLNVVQKYPNSQYVGQQTVELATLYMGKENRKECSEYYPGNISHSLYTQNRVRVFSSAVSWFRNMERIDLSIGSRLHGNVAAVLSGTPMIIMPKDARIRELTSYHDFPCILPDDLREDMTLEEVVNSVDLTSHIRRQSSNFNHFVDFLDVNGIEHIYKTDRNRKTAPLDLALPDALDIYDYVGFEPATVCSREELVNRVLMYSGNHDRSLAPLKKTISEQEKQIKDLKESNKRLRKVINSRSVRYPFKVRNLLVSKEKKIDLDDL